MVLEARLVSSCFSFPSRASPRFSLLSLSSGVMVYTLQNVELGDTWSLGDCGMRSENKALGRIRMSVVPASSHLQKTSLSPFLLGHNSQRNSLICSRKCTSRISQMWQECLYGLVWGGFHPKGSTLQFPRHTLLSDWDPELF